MVFVFALLNLAALKCIKSYEKFGNYKAYNIVFFENISGGNDASLLL